MAGKYNYSLERVNMYGQKEVFAVTGCDSFDEAIKMVTKGVYERKLAEDEKMSTLPQAGLMGPVKLNRPIVPGAPVDLPRTPIYPQDGGSGGTVGEGGSLSAAATPGGSSANPQG